MMHADWEMVCWWLKRIAVHQADAHYFERKANWVEFLARGLTPSDS